MDPRGPIETKTKGSRRVLVFLCALGVGVRGLLLILAGDVELMLDEASYVYHALSWNHFGFYSDSGRFLWPPGYPFFLAQCLNWFGDNGLLVARWVQVLTSAVIGASIMLFARDWFGRRAMWLAGILWVFYLPLAAFTHYLWTETIFLALFLPGLYQLWRALSEGRSLDRSLLAAGLLMGLALFIKDLPLYLTGLFAVLIAVRAPCWWEGIRRSSLFALAILVVLVPWTLRNYSVYASVVPVGETLGENFYKGLNARYLNFDFTEIAKLQGVAYPEEVARNWFLDVDREDAWQRSEETFNLVERGAVQRDLALAFAADHPGWLLRSRLKKLADLVVPVSFFHRHLATGRYEGRPIASAGIRHGLVLWGALCPVLALLLGWLGFLGCLPSGNARWLVGLSGGYLIATSLLVALSRYRIPLVPLLLILSAGLLTRGWLPSRRTTGSRICALAGAATLCFLWWINAPEVQLCLRSAWRP